MAVRVVALLMLDQEPVLSDSMTGPQEDVKTKDGILVFIAGGGLAVMFPGFEPQSLG
jgi:hypothetical protein